jgi:hypothetical protein
MIRIRYNLTTRGVQQPLSLLRSRRSISSSGLRRRSGLARADRCAVKIEYKHSLAIRWMHWINFPLLALMIYSGLLIYWADSQH